MLHSTRKSAWRRSVLLVISAVLVMTMLAACGGNGNGKTEGTTSGKTHSLEFKGVSEGDVVATYKDGKVTKAEFDKYLAIFAVSQPTYEQVIVMPQFQQMILEQYVSYKVLGKKATEKSLEQASKDVDDQLAQYEEGLKKDAELAAKVKEKNITTDDIATFLMLTSAVVVHMNSQVTDEDIKKAYEGMRADFAVSDVRHILIGTVETNPQTGEKKELRTEEAALALAKEVKAKLDAGGDFAALAKEHSDDPGSKDKGGLYEKAEGKGWMEEFKKAAFEQKVGVVGEPVKSSYGYHIIKVEKRDEIAYDKLSEENKGSVKSAAAYVYMDKFLKEEMPKQELKMTLPEVAPPTEGEEEAAK